MTGADTAIEATDTDTVIKRWRASERRVEQIAAELAAKIDAGRLHRWAELPSLPVLADEYDVSERTISFG
jgi:DNA-binding GntR family transcriptional regulator